MPVGDQLRSEERVVLRSVREYLGTAAPDVEAGPSRLDVDWERFDRVAQRHHVRPLVYRVLLNRDEAAVPSAVTERWRDYLRQNTAQNLYLTGELASILDAFDEQGVSALPFKGAVLAATAYGDVAHREFVDIDLIIDPDAFGRAKATLQERGYEVQHKMLASDQMTASQESLVVEFGRECEFLRASDGVAVDLHWRFLPRRSTFPLSFADANARRESVEVAGATVPTMSTTDTLLLLAVHGTRHSWQHLRETCDLAALVQRCDVDWQTVVRRAEAMGCRRRLGIGIQLARELLGLSVPSFVVERTIDADPEVERLVRGAREWLLDPEPTVAGRNRLRYKYAAHERLSDRLSFLLHWGFSPHRKEIEAVALPGWLRPLYHVVRPIRLLAEGYGRRF